MTTNSRESTYMNMEVAVNLNESQFFRLYGQTESITKVSGDYSDKVRGTHRGDLRHGRHDAVLRELRAHELHERRGGGHQLLVHDAELLSVVYLVLAQFLKETQFC